MRLNAAVIACEGYLSFLSDAIAYQLTWQPFAGQSLLTSAMTHSFCQEPSSTEQLYKVLTALPQQVTRHSAAF